MKADEDANGKTVVARAYAKGPIGHNTTVTAGRIPLLDTYGMLLDEHMSGAQIDITSGSDKNFTTSLLAGRYNPGHDNPDILPGQTLNISMVKISIPIQMQIDSTSTLISSINKLNDKYFSLNKIKINP